MVKTLHRSLLAAALIPFSMAAQSITPFTNTPSLLPTTNYAGNAVGVCDMNGDFKDDIVRDSSNARMRICFQQLPNAVFTQTSYLTPSFGSPWGLCVGDYNNDGYNDVFQGSSSNGYLLTSNSATSFSHENMTSTYGGGSVFTQGCNFADIDNDGALDVFICHDVGMPKVYMGNGSSGGWVFDQSVLPLATVPASDNSGNYASIWTDVNDDDLIDLMITHCRQSVSNPTDARRIDQVFINNGDGTYTQDLTNWTNLRDGAQGWSTAWGDIDNDGDNDAFVLNYDVQSKLMINDGTGVFSDVFATSGIASTLTYFGENASFHDFDNDGYIDILISGDEHYVYRNNGNQTFTLVTEPFPYIVSSQQRYMRGQGVGDLNGDGFLDVYATYANLYNSPSTSRADRAWINTCAGNGNHWVKYSLVGGAIPGMTNKNGIGAIIKIYGSWGVQQREVRSGEAYGLQNSLSVYFGLGAGTTIDSTVVIWPSGIVDHLLSLPVDQSYTLNEGNSPTSVATTATHEFRMSMGPNPMNDQVTIQLFNTAQYGLNNLSLQIVDVTGKLVYSESSLTNNVIVLDKSILAAGLYVVQVNNGDQRLASEKLMVH